MDYRRFDNTYVIRMERGEEIVEQVRRFAEREGVKLRDDVLSRLGTIDALVSAVEQASPETVAAYRARLGQQTYRNNRQRCRKGPALAQCGSFLVWMRKRIERFNWSFDACTFTVLRIEKSAMRAVMTCSRVSAFLAPRPCITRCTRAACR